MSRRFSERPLSERVYGILFMPLGVLIVIAVTIYLYFERNPWKNAWGKPPARRRILRERIRNHFRDRRHKNDGIDSKVMTSLGNTTRSHLRRRSA